MPLKFNPFTGTLDYIGAGKEEITNANVKAAAGIEESKLSLPEVIKKLTVQTIEGEKHFETPEPAEGSGLVGTASAAPLNAKSGTGGKTSSATNATGGNSGRLEFLTGTGGSATTAVKTNTGGTSGLINNKTGAGGEASSSAENNKGGSSGGGTFNTGVGGPASGESTVKNTGGGSGAWTGGTGVAGEARNSKVTNEGGNSGTITNATGGGGIATSTSSTTNKGGKSGSWTAGTGAGGEAKNTEGEKAEGGTSGEVKLQTGAGGAAVTTTGKKTVGANAGNITIETGAGGNATGGSETNTVGLGGNIRVVLGDGGGATEGNSGAFQIYYGKAEVAKLRLEVTPTGNVIIKKSLTVSTNIEAEGTLGCLGKLTVGKAKANSPAEMRSGLVLSATENFKLETEKSKTLKPANSLSIVKLAVSVVASTTITGLEFPAEVQHEGTLVTIFNEVSSKPAKILHNNTESTEEFRFWLRGAAAEVELKEREGMMFQLLGASNNARWVQL